MWHCYNQTPSFPYAYYDSKVSQQTFIKMENTKRIGSEPYLIPARVIFIHEFLKPSFILVENALQISKF